MNSMEKNNFGGFTAGGEMVFEKRGDKISVPVCEKTVVTELSDDLILPDYRPEIRRLLRISASLPTPSPYVSSDMAEFSGDVIYSILYVGGDGKLASAELTAVYDAEAEFPSGMAENIIAWDEIAAENIVGRVTAPRKLNIRCRLRHTVRAVGEMPTDVELSADTGTDGIMRLTETYPSCFFAIADDDSYDIEENFPVGAEARIICAEAVPFIGDVQVKNGEAALRGSVSVRVLYDTEGGDPISIDRKIPFEAALPITAEGDGWEATAHGTAAGIYTDIEDGTLRCKIRLSLAVAAQKDMPAVVTKDIFAVDRTCDIKHAEIQSLVSRYCGVGNFTLSGSSELSGVPEEYEVISANATAEPGELSAENGKYVLTGKCRFSALIRGAEEYSCREFELPFRYEFGRADGDCDDYTAVLSCPIVRVRGDGNVMTADAEICASVRALSRKNILAVREAVFGEPEDLGAKPAYTVVYVSEGESLWDLSKRYSADPEAVAKANGLRVGSPAAQDSLEGVDFLII